MKKLTKDNLPKLYESKRDSHKGENGRLLVIGGSKLFHASIFWSADVASKIVDLVHFSSPAEENNDLIRKKLKEGFWNGIVVPYERIEEYIKEDDCVLIGPGMPRSDGLEKGEKATKEIVDYLLSKYSNKRWVVDGGALQEISVDLLNSNHIITPHFREFVGLVDRSLDEFLISNLEFLNKFQNTNDQIDKLIDLVSHFSKLYNRVTVLLKGEVDIVCQGDECEVIEGGNSGMTKGGTGDVLAGLVAGLYCKNDAMTATTVASFVNKKAGESLFEKMGNYFNATDLVKEVPGVLKDL